MSCPQTTTVHRDFTYSWFAFPTIYCTSWINPQLRRDLTPVTYKVWGWRWSQDGSRHAHSPSACVRALCLLEPAAGPYGGWGRRWGRRTEPPDTPRTLHRSPAEQNEKRRDVLMRFGSNINSETYRKFVYELNEGREDLSSSCIIR